MSDPFVALQRVLPQHALSRLAGMFTSSTHPWIRRPLIRLVSQAFGISLDEAARRSPDEYRSFDDFFTRELAPGARPMPSDPNVIVSPADGTVSQTGRISNATLLQAKGIGYSLEGLLTDADLARRLDGGWFATVYLAPADYHRVHMPFDGTLIQTVTVPGALFSVNARTENGVAGLFCRNERLVCVFDTAFGPLAVVLVGALIVASIETVWDGPASPYRDREIRTHALPLARGAEIGRFRMGSTVIVVAPPTCPDIVGLTPGCRMRMGEALTATTAAPLNFDR
jgi:phosphatidylserine decarboxylase